MDMNKLRNSQGKRGFAGKRKLRFGIFAAVLTLAVVAVVIMLNVAVGAVETNWGLTVDLTRIGATDFSQATFDVLDSFEEPVHIYTVYQPGTNSSLRLQVENILEKYRAYNHNIALDTIDPVSEPSRVQQYAGEETVSEGAIIVTNADASRVRVVQRSDYYYNYTSSITRQTHAMFNVEGALTSAILYVTSDATPRVFYLTGHNELDAATYCTMLTEWLTENNYEVAVLDLANGGETLRAGDVLVVIDPRRDMSEAEYQVLSRWLAEGGRLLMSLNYDVDQSVLNNFHRLLEEYHMGFGDGYIQESENSASNWREAVYSLVPNMDAEHEITAPLAANGMTLLFPYARPLLPVDFPESGNVYDTILFSSNQAVVVNGDETSAPGSFPIAMTMLRQDSEDPSRDVRILLMGGYNVLANTVAMSYSYNPNFLLNAFQWLVNVETTVSIAPRIEDEGILAIPDAATAWSLAAVVVIAIPLAVAIAGIVVWVKRRRK